MIIDIIISKSILIAQDNLPVVHSGLFLNPKYGWHHSDLQQKVLPEIKNVKKYESLY